ncbi:MAG TPA: hypothetical protein VFG23_07695, partial [Polyangia bacterium]|nr:hypothetical protein [Polyangia bacterium]
TAFSYPHWKWPFSSEIFESQQPEKITTCRPLPAFSAAHARAECPFRVNSVIGTWKQVSISGIAVTNGTCQIGVQTTGGANQWIDVDDVALVKISN